MCCRAGQARGARPGLANAEEFDAQHDRGHGLPSSHELQCSGGALRNSTPVATPAIFNVALIGIVSQERCGGAQLSSKCSRTRRIISYCLEMERRQRRNGTGGERAEYYKTLINFSAPYYARTHARTHTHSHACERTGRAGCALVMMCARARSLA